MLRHDHNHIVDIEKPVASFGRQCNRFTEQDLMNEPLSG